MKKIFFRADASTKVGWGHLTRCVSLASMLREKFKCTFLLKDSADFAYKMLEEKSFSFTKLGASELADEALEVSSILNSGDIVVVDGYQFNEAYFAQIKSSAARLVLIDDFLKVFPQADAIINHAVDLSEDDFPPRGEIRLCLGEKYAMLRPPFLEMAGRPRTISKVENVFVCFGGADNNNVTLKVLQALDNTPLKVHVVLASTFPYTSEVKAFIDSASVTAEVYHDLSAEQMAALMSRCEVAVAPTSGLSYEICAVGMAFLGGYYIDNQISIHNGFLKRNCLISLNDFTKVSVAGIREKFDFLLSDINRLNDLIASQKKTIDGKSAEKFIDLFSSL
ncbi:MAG: UDP-2,4-diacetamido-2,4,6-trideoxy-beta-L-altropyranose hydrolase [Flavobacteriales bacterium]